MTGAGHGPSGSRLPCALLWLWVIGIFAAYMYQFLEFLPAILKLIGISP